MRVFLSWSGERSGQIAQALKVWLTDVMHVLEPWISSEDIDKGARWSLKLAQGLQETSVGIICLTPENLTAPWILFEAGALAKYVEASRVCTYLVQVRPADIDGPLASFQATEANKTDTLRLVTMLNGLLGEHSRPSEQLNRAFEKWWPEFEAVLLRFQKTRPGTAVQRSDRDILEEILGAVRLQERASAKVDPAWPSQVSTLQQLLAVDPKEVESLLEELKASHREDRQDAETNQILMSQTVRADGVWMGAWSGHAFPSTRTGIAKIVSTQDYLVILETDDRSPVGPYLLVARRRNDGVFVGRYVNLQVPRDSTAWIGIAVSTNQIYGQWKQGPWDFSIKSMDN